MTLQQATIRVEQQVQQTHHGMFVVPRTTERSGSESCGLPASRVKRASTGPEQRVATFDVADSMDPLTALTGHPVWSKYELPGSRTSGPQSARFLLARALNQTGCNQPARHSTGSRQRTVATDSGHGESR
ncbi:MULTISPECIES: hypothetical protein [unclassified Streptomyces]|uniref:hypothetical protein n=1 Tax=unclassified Streptomyces TaxID=2593676 RepID=UPI00114D0752|nr:MULTISPECIES: hypothetical protein [unclassified Streptomyces]MYS21558.1 hypothetical protein [Streptomyces sp. SID4948]